MIDNRELILEDCDTGTCLIYLYAHDDGEMYLYTPNDPYKLLEREIWHIADESFLHVEASEGSKSSMLFIVKDSLYQSVDDYLEYWNQDKLEELKAKKLASFFDFFAHLFNFVETEVLIYNDCVADYEVYGSDNREYGGFHTIQIKIHIGDSFLLDGDYHNYFAFNEMFMDSVFDKYGLEDDYKWWSDIFIHFVP